MHEVLPLRDLCCVVANGFDIDESYVTSFRATVWEDNAGALALAQLDPRQHTGCTLEILRRQSALVPL